MKQTRSPLYPIFLFVIINLIIFTLSRLGLAIWQADRVSAVAGWGQLFLQGLRMDIVALCYLFGVPALFTVLFHNSRIWKMILRIWLTLGLSLIHILGFLSEVFMLTEFGNWIEQGLTWVIEHFDEPLWNITIVILLGVGLFFTITTGLVPVSYTHLQPLH